MVFWAKVATICDATISGWSKTYIHIYIHLHNLLFPARFSESSRETTKLDPYLAGLDQGFLLYTTMSLQNTRGCQRASPARMGKQLHKDSLTRYTCILLTFQKEVE